MLDTEVFIIDEFSSLVAAKSLLLESEVGLYPKDTMRNTLERFQWTNLTPAQSMPEMLMDTIEGWKSIFPEYFAKDSPFMVSFNDTPFGQVDVLKPVAVLGDRSKTTRWASGPVPYCYHDRNISWDLTGWI